jgi:hypothetical protein
MCRGIKIQLFFVVYPSALRFLNTDSVAMWLRPPFCCPLRESFLDHCRRQKMVRIQVQSVIFLRAGKQALTSFNSEPKVKSDNRSLHKQRRGQNYSTIDSVENDMTERDQARAAQTKVGRGDWIPRPTKAEVLADVPGARNVKPELLPEGVQHLSNVSAGVVARYPKPKVAVKVIVGGLETDPKVGR